MKAISARFLLTWIALCMAPSLAAQECDDARAQDLLRAAYPAAESADDGSLVLAEGGISYQLTAACKVWPARPEFTLLAVNLQGPDDREQGISQGDLEVLVVSNGQDQVRYRHRDAHVLDGDAIFVDGVGLDTARYRLSAQIMAFGVRIGRRNMSQPNPFHLTTLRLYALDPGLAQEQGLRLVLRDLEVESSGGEWDMRCAGERNEISRTLAIDAAKEQHGLADLMVRGKATAITSRLEGEECVDQQVVRVEPARRLRFDGGTYPIPDALQGLDEDYAQ